jgi:hypothetical protein
MSHLVDKLACRSRRAMAGQDRRAGPGDAKRASRMIRRTAVERSKFLGLSAPVRDSEVLVLKGYPFGLLGRVKHLRGEEKLRHASLQDFREQDE